MKIDLHVHTKERSGCGRSATRDMIRAAIAAGLDAIALTDHDRLAPPEVLEALNAEFAPFQVFGGIEIDIQQEHAVVLGVQEPVLESRRWQYGELHAFVRERNGFLFVAHPYRYHPELRFPVDQHHPDAFEIHSTHTAPEDAAHIVETATRLQAGLLSNSDAHDVSVLGRYYNVLKTRVTTDKDLVHALRARQFTPHQANPHPLPPLTVR